MFKTKWFHNLSFFGNKAVIVCNIMVVLKLFNIFNKVYQIFNLLQLLPEPTAVNSRIPIDHFGDAVMVVEFVNCFSSIFDLKASFPKGFSLGKYQMYNY